MAGGGVREKEGKGGGESQLLATESLEGERQGKGKGKKPVDVSGRRSRLSHSLYAREYTTAATTTASMADRTVFFFCSLSLHFSALRFW